MTLKNAVMLKWIEAQKNRNKKTMDDVIKDLVRQNQKEKKEGNLEKLKQLKKQKREKERK